MLTTAGARRVFAALMKKARERTLTAREKKALVIARQTLRVRAKSARNPRPIPYETFKKFLEARGYLPASLRPDLVASLYEFYQNNKKERAEYERWKKGQGLFAGQSGLFNPRRRRPVARKNPGGRGTVIYGQVIEIVCRRTGPHRCDAACKRVNHTYRHVFKSRPAIRGLNDGRLVIG